MSLSDLQKLWTESTKIGHIFRKQSTLKSKFSKDFIYKSWSPSQIFCTEKKVQKDSVDFWCPKNAFQSTNFCKLWGGCL